MVIGDLVASIDWKCLVHVTDRILARSGALGMWKWIKGLES